MAPSDRPLADRVALVAGATRGSGRGLAVALGEAGATVYCSGRSTAGSPSPYGRSETIDETAALVTAGGGEGIAVRVDHGREDEVTGLIGRIERERGRLDVLADSVAGMDPLLGSWGYWDADLSNGDAILHQALLSHVITAKHALPLMRRHKGGLMVQVTEGDTLGCGGNVLTVLAKTALKILALTLAQTVRTDGVTVVAATPGFLRSEAMLDHFGVTEANWRDAGAKDQHFLESETPLFLGRGVASLAADPDRLTFTGQVVSSWELARRYEVDDANGTRPDWGRHFERIVPDMADFRSGVLFEAGWLEQLAERARRTAGPG